MPAVTVVIPVYNRALMLAQALESLRAQTFRDFDVVVSDNASEDDLAAVVARFEDLPIRYHRIEKQVPFLENFTTGANLCQVEFLKFLCSDDLLLPDALADLVAAMRANPSAGICLGGCVTFTDHPAAPGAATPVRLDSVRPMPRLPARRGPGWMRPDGFFEEGGFGYSLTPTACLYRMSYFHEAGGINRGIAAIFDWELFVTISGRWEVAVVMPPVCVFREHPEQWTKEARGGGRFLRDVYWITSADNPLRARLGIPWTQQVFWRFRSAVFVWTDLLRGLRRPHAVRVPWGRTLAQVPWLHCLLALPWLPLFWLLEKAHSRRKAAARDPLAMLPPEAVRRYEAIVQGILRKWPRPSSTR